MANGTTTTKTGTTHGNASTEAAFRYQSGFGNEFASEAMEGVLPQGQNSPRDGARAVHGATQWYTIHRSARAQSPHVALPDSSLGGAQAFPTDGAREPAERALEEVPAPPNQLRWHPIPVPSTSTDFVDGLITMAGNGNAPMQIGVAIHIYVANASMRDRFFYNADGEMLMVPQLGAILLRTEMGVLAVHPGEIAVIQRGIRFRVELAEKEARGYVCENYGALLRLPDLGPIGSNGLANPRDFLAPVAAFEDAEGDYRITAKFQGRLWEAAIDHSPLDVVAWHGNYVPYKYDLANFNCINTVSFDHPDPSIYVF